ncbi:pyridoxal-phosphate dependent enzyme [bacterium]|nr:pyridoxal-phosphate dependent enzyme [bacterium]
MALPTLEGVRLAVQNLDGVALESPLQKNLRLSEKCQAQVFFKREDLQQVRSFKIRGAYNTICRLSKEERQKGIVCSSAGNHAQGVANACKRLRIPCEIVMPATAPELKIKAVNNNVTVHLSGSFTKSRIRSWHSNKSTSVFLNLGGGLCINYDPKAHIRPRTCGSYLTFSKS